MEIKYILLYGTPYLKQKYFNDFKVMSAYIVKKGIVDYTIYEKMDDEKEIRMILEE